MPIEEDCKSDHSHNSQEEWEKWQQNVKYERFLQEETGKVEDSTIPTLDDNRDISPKVRLTHYADSTHNLYSDN